MPVSSPHRFRRDWIVASPHRDSFARFVNPESSTESDLHALLREAFSHPIPGTDGNGARVDYRGYRIVNGQEGTQPGSEFYARQRTYQRLVKVRLKITAGGKTTEEEHLLAHLPWMTARDTFVI